MLYEKRYSHSSTFVASHFSNDATTLAVGAVRAGAVLISAAATALQTVVFRVEWVGRGDRRSAAGVGVTLDG